MRMVKRAGLTDLASFGSMTNNFSTHRSQSLLQVAFGVEFHAGEGDAGDATLSAERKKALDKV